MKNPCMVVEGSDALEKTEWLCEYIHLEFFLCLKKCIDTWCHCIDNEL